MNERKAVRPLCDAQLRVAAKKNDMGGCRFQLTSPPSSVAPADPGCPPERRDSGGGDMSTNKNFERGNGITKTADNAIWRDDGMPGENLRIYFGDDLIDILAWRNGEWVDDCGLIYPTACLGTVWEAYKSELDRLRQATSPKGLQDLLRQREQHIKDRHWEVSWPCDYSIDGQSFDPQRYYCVRLLLDAREREIDALLGWTHSWKERPDSWFDGNLETLKQYAFREYLSDTSVAALLGEEPFVAPALTAVKDYRKKARRACISGQVTPTKSTAWLGYGTTKGGWLGVSWKVWNHIHDEITAKVAEAVRTERPADTVCWRAKFDLVGKKPVEIEVWVDRTPARGRDAAY